MSDEIRTVLQMASRHSPSDGKRVETIYALLHEMYPGLDYSVSFKAQIAQTFSEMLTIPIGVTLIYDGMPVNTVEEVKTFLLAHDRSEQQAEETIRTLKFILSLI